MNKIFTGKKYISTEEKERATREMANQKGQPIGKDGDTRILLFLFCTENKLARENEEIFPGDSHLNVSDMHPSGPELTLVAWKVRPVQIDVERNYCTCQVRITTDSSLFFSSDSLNIKVSLACPLSAFSWQCFWFAFHLQGGIEDGKESIRVVSSFCLSLFFVQSNKQKCHSEELSMINKQTNEWSILELESADVRRLIVNESIVIDNNHPGKRQTVTVDDRLELIDRI